VASRIDLRRAGAGLLLLLAAVGSASACGVAASDERPAIVATTTQIGALTSVVGGDHIALTTLLTPGAEAHDFEPKASDARKVNDAMLILRNGIGLDDFLDGILEGNAGGRVVTVTEGVSLLRGAGDDTDEDDPHVWLDPMNAKVMVDNIAKALSDADAPHADAYAQNATAYKAKLDRTDAEIRTLIDAIPPANRKMVTDHDAFGYFIKRYGLTYVGAVLPTTTAQGEPSAKELAELENTIRAQGVKAIFAEESVDSKVAKRIADDTKVKIVTGLYGDSLGRKGSGAETVDGMLLANARKITDALR
jgi:ABC-type Zn uptake system ZnuABC Zn-binding protein ZnuA